ncbi:MAG: hypothetical protein RIE08_02585 [Acidimicrobiales bacterium]
MERNILVLAIGASVLMALLLGCSSTSRQAGNFDKSEWRDAVASEAGSGELLGLFPADSVFVVGCPGPSDENDVPRVEAFATLDLTPESAATILRDGGWTLVDSDLASVEAIKELPGESVAHVRIMFSGEAILLQVRLAVPDVCESGLVFPAVPSALR